MVQAQGIQIAGFRYIRIRYALLQASKEHDTCIEGFRKQVSRTGRF
jgi:hypothetical protein